MEQNNYTRLKQEADIERVVHYLGMQVTRRGSSFLSFVRYRDIRIITLQIAILNQVGTIYIAILAVRPLMQSI